MEEEDNNQYLLELEKLMSSEVAIAKWAPTMDILALATFDNFVEGYRISFKAQRFFHVEESQSVESMCFSPDSQVLAYGLLDGSVKLIKTENGQKMILLEHLGCQNIQNLNFLPFAEIDPQNFMPFTKDSIENKLILNISPHKNCNKNAIIKINYFNELKPKFTCLLLSDSSKTYLLLNGFMQTLEINYREVLSIQQQHSYRVLFSHLHDNQLYSVIAEEIQTTYELSLVRFELENYMYSNKQKSEIISWSCLLSNLNEIFSFIENTYSVLEGQVRDIIRQYNSKINLIDDGSSGDVVPCKELLNYLTIGLTSSTLINFFSKEVYDSKILQKLDETLTNLFAQLHDILLESVQNGLEKSTLIIKKLLSWVDENKRRNKNQHQNDKFGIIAEQLLQAEQMMKRLYTLGEMLLIQSTQAKFNIRNLLVWLNKTTIKTSQENDGETQNAKSYLNKYTVDYNRLHKFLQNEDIFRLQNLLHFFRKTENLSPIKFMEADFSLLPSQPVERPQIKQKKKQNYQRLEKLLGLEQIQLKDPLQNTKNAQFYSFKIQMSKLLKLWKQICAKPLNYLSHQISSRYNTQKIGKVEINQDYQFRLHTLQKQGVLFLYYVEYPDDVSDHYIIIQYNCHTTEKSYLYTTQYKIHSISLCNDEIVGVLEEKTTGIKIIGQISNSSFNGGEIEIGRRMSNCDQGNLEIECSQRGLNCLFVDKSKLVVFD